MTSPKDQTLRRICKAARIRVRRDWLGTRYATDGVLRCKVSSPQFEEWIQHALMEQVYTTGNALAEYHRRTVHTQRDRHACIAAAVTAIEAMEDQTDEET